MPQDPLNEAQELPKGLQVASESTQEAPRKPPGSPQEPGRHKFEAVWWLVVLLMMDMYTCYMYSLMHVSGFFHM